MPSRNINKEQAPDSYYHIYARGSNKQKIYLDTADYKYFLRLFERYLSEKPAVAKDSMVYPHYHGAIELTS